MKSRKAGMPMLIATPVPYSILTATPNVALIQNMARFNEMFGRFETLPSFAQYQLLDDASGTLSGYAPHLPLVMRIESHRRKWNRPGPELASGSPDIATLQEIIAATETDTSEVSRFLENWNHLAYPQRLLALNLAEHALGQDERHQEMIASIQSHRLELKNAQLIPDNPPLLEELRWILSGMDSHLSPDATALADRLDTWPDLNDAARNQVLQDIIPSLRNYFPYRPLAKRIENQLYHLQSGDHSIQDPQLLADIQAAISIIGTSHPQVSPNEDHHANLARYRLITRPLTGSSAGAILSQGQAILMRAPAYIMRPPTPKAEIIHEFGKVIPELWSEDRASAEKHFRDWFLDNSRHGRMSEIHTFSATRERADRHAALLAAQGFDVRQGSFPAYLYPRRSAEDTTGQVMHFVVAGSAIEPVSRWIRDFVTEKETPPIGRIDLMGEATSPDDPEFLERLHALFYRPIGLDNILDGFSMDVPGYVTSRVQLDRFNSSGVSITIDIATEDGEIASRLEGSIPKLPKPGEDWIAWGADLNSQLPASDARKIAQHMKQGIGRRAMQKILTFLHQLGVNALDMEAHWQGLSFMPHIGFDFRDTRSRNQVVADFASFRDEMDIPLSPQKQSELAGIQHSWQVLDFQADDGSYIGREFLDYYSRVQKKSLHLRFWLRPNYPGWRRLFSRQLAPNGENTSKRSTPESQYSDQQKTLLMEKLRRLSQSRFLLDPSIPEEVRERLAEVTDLARYFELEATQSRHDADHDALTGLLTRQRFMAYNLELEKSTLSPRADTGEKVHWVLMADVDHFKGVNDTHGHVVGDDVLRHVAKILKREAREYDLVGRYGGEEFCIVLRHSGDKGVRLVAERIRAAIAAEPIRSQSNGSIVEIPISISIGAARFKVIPPNGNGNGNPYAELGERRTSLMESLDDADRALYRAKKSGRNRVEYSR